MRHGEKINKTSKSNNKKINQNGHANTTYSTDDVKCVRFVISHVAGRLCGVYPKMLVIYYCYTSAKFWFSRTNCSCLENNSAWRRRGRRHRVTPPPPSAIYFVSPTIDVFRYNYCLKYTDISTKWQN